MKREELSKKLYFAKAYERSIKNERKNELRPLRNAYKEGFLSKAAYKEAKKTIEQKLENDFDMYLRKLEIEYGTYLLWREEPYSFAWEQTMQEITA